MMQAASPFISMTNAAFNDVRAFVSDDGFTFWLSVSGILYFYEGIIGAAELAMGKEDARVINPVWWFRQLFIQGMAGIFVTVGVKFAENICIFGVGSFGDAITAIFHNWLETVMTFYQGQSHMTAMQMMNKSLLALNGNMVLDVGSQILGNVLSMLVGCICILFCTMQIFLAIGCSAFTCCLGPICIPFGASSATQDIALGWLKMFLVYCVLYIPLLALAFQIAGDVMATNSVIQMMNTAGGNNMVFDLIEGMICNLYTPIAMLGFVIAVPHILSKALK